jgi:hypothetical protein
MKVSDLKDFYNNFRKKLKHLSISLTRFALYLKIYDSEELIIKILEYVLKKGGAHYLRLDSLQVLRQYMESNILFSLDCNKIRG